MRTYTVGLMLLLLACRDAPSRPANCPDVLIILIAPRDTTIVVGQHFAPAVEVAECGSIKVSDTFTFSSSRPEVAYMHPMLRRVIAREPGITTITVQGARYGLLGTIEVRVVTALSP